MSWATLNFIADLLADSSKHFLLAFGAGFLAFLLTSTMLSHITGSLTLMPGSCIHRCSLLVALCFAVAAHVLEDYYLGWF